VRLQGPADGLDIDLLFPLRSLVMATAIASARGQRTAILSSPLRELPAVQCAGSGELSDPRNRETLSEGDATVELAAILVPTTAEPDELDAVITALEKAVAIKSATWTVGTTA
jgi:hypothetical protein